MVMELHPTNKWQIINIYIYIYIYIYIERERERERERGGAHICVSGLDVA